MREFTRNRAASQVHFGDKSDSRPHFLARRKQEEDEIKTPWDEDRQLLRPNCSDPQGATSNLCVAETQLPVKADTEDH